MRISMLYKIAKEHERIIANTYIEEQRNFYYDYVISIFLIQKYN